ncbi:hypothetical protein QR680_014427 [Steinernema hermaphroditum]|uniref:Uncharacterized protein n=1 Tax=Steinernema hermaphroditum TaxID=289476 RepID=A0AA39M360_9BILA|nr:hypothetical protein QR680_014427 [Steinernema hermaphroditum]
MRRAPPVPVYGQAVNQNPAIVIAHSDVDLSSSFRSVHDQRRSSLNVDTSNNLGVQQLQPLSVSPLNVTYLKKRYDRQDSLLGMEIPVFDRNKKKVQKKGPSSAATVLTMAGLFICGAMLILSGIIVLIQAKIEFIITGCIFMGLGILMVFICLVLQWKNVVKYFLDLNRDLYFISMSEGRKMGLEERSNLPIPNSD